MSRFGMLIDIGKCNGCYNCFLACRDEYYGNDYPPYSAAQPLEGQFWMQVKEIERGSYPRPKLSYLPIACMHCKDAPCMKAAQNGAIYRREDGIVIIDPEKAKGQKAIVSACPYRVIFWNPEKEIGQKCTLCAHHLDKGEKEPRCVDACPTGALVFGDLDDPESEISKLSAELNTEVLHPEYDTRPTVCYVGIPKRFIAGEVVLKDKQGECAQGVKVLLEGEGLQLETATDVYGDFEFDGLGRNLPCRITFDHNGYKSLQIQVVTQKDLNLGEIVLEPE
jgi:Fe-S-cluster-containing dehydrogenase component